MAEVDEVDPCNGKLMRGLQRMTGAMVYVKVGARWYEHQYVCVNVCLSTTNGGTDVCGTTKDQHNEVVMQSEGTTEFET